MVRRDDDGTISRHSLRSVKLNTEIGETQRIDEISDKVIQVERPRIQEYRVSQWISKPGRVCYHNPRQGPNLTEEPTVGYAYRLALGVCKRLFSAEIASLYMSGHCLKRRRSKVKPGIHPKYEDTKVTCACGESFVTRSTRKEIHVEICSACHPFFTGKQKLVDTAGRVERFQRKYGKKTEPATT